MTGDIELSMNVSENTSGDFSVSTKMNKLNGIVSEANGSKLTFYLAADNIVTENQVWADIFNAHIASTRYYGFSADGKLNLLCGDDTPLGATSIFYRFVLQKE